MFYPQNHSLIDAFFMYSAIFYGKWNHKESSDVMLICRFQAAVYNIWLRVQKNK